MMFGALAVLPALTGCPGSLEGDYPTVVGMGSGGNSSSGGTTGSGGSGSGGSGSGGSAGTVCDAPNTVFKNVCAMSGCHDGSQPPMMTADGLAGRLIGAQAAISCGKEMNIVDTTKPATGTLLVRIAGSTCIEQMPPPPMDALSPTDQKCIVDWLTAQLH